MLKNLNDKNGKKDKRYNPCIELKNIIIDPKNIPLIYKYKIIEIFLKYNNTNNGVVLNDAYIVKLITEISKQQIIKKGGTTLNERPDLLHLLNEYCSTIVNDETDIDNFKKGNNSTLSNYQDLGSFITSNSTTKTKDITISYDPIYDYNKCNKSNHPNNKIIKSYNCFDYNYGIVTAYETYFYTDENKNSINKFINKQKEYIERLHIKEKRIIQDYTNNNSFNYYKYYKSPPPPSEIPQWRMLNNFNDAFYKQINDLYPDIFQNTIGITYETWLLRDRIDINTAEQTKFHILSDDEWNRVLDKFMEDLDNIIIKAPPVEEEFYCYRGVTGHYINSQIDVPQNLIELLQGAPRLRTFLSNRLSSFSFDFNVSKNFSDESDKVTRSVYRTTILPQCRVLYVAQLSVFKYEVEFISPSNSIFYYNPEQIDESTLIPNKKSINNINKIHGICSKEGDKFNSFDTILAFTPQPRNSDGYNVYQEALTIANNTTTNFKTKHQNVTDLVTNTVSDIGTDFLNICNAVCCMP